MNAVFLVFTSHQLFEHIYDMFSEKAMAPHSSTLAWKIPWVEEPRGLQSIGSLRVGHDWVASLSLFTSTFHFPALEKEMATYSSVLAWRIPGMGEPGGLPSLGSHRVRHDWSSSTLCSLRLFQYPGIDFKMGLLPSLSYVLLNTLEIH